MKKTTFIAALVVLTLGPAIHAQKIVPFSEHTHASTPTASTEPLIVGQAAAWAAAKAFGVEIDRESKPLFELEEVTKGDERSWWMSLSVGDKESSGRLIEIVGTDREAGATFEKRMPQLESIDAFSVERSVVATIIGSADRVNMGGEIVHLTLTDGSEMRMFVPLAAGGTTEELERFLKRGHDFRVSGGLPPAGPASKHLPNCPGDTDPACLQDCDAYASFDAQQCSNEFTVCQGIVENGRANCLLACGGLDFSCIAACSAQWFGGNEACAVWRYSCMSNVDWRQVTCYDACHVAGGF